MAIAGFTPNDTDWCICQCGRKFDGKSVDVPRRGTHRAMSRLSLTSSESERLVNRLKNTNLEKFHTLCKMHLSFLLDMPGASLEQFLGELEVGTALSADKRPNFLHFGKKKSNKENKCAGTGLFGAPLSPDVIEQIYPVIEFLGREDIICQEGLFRKSGQIGRQRLMRERLNTGEDLELDNGLYTAHDCASLLKTLLSELPEPLLTDKHNIAYSQILEMTSEEKQLQVLQLLVQLLPRDNYIVLECLLELLHRVSLEESNKMSAEALGTLFAPHLLVPKKMSASEIQATASNLTKVVSFLIERAPQIFKVPATLVRDIASYWQDMEEISENTRQGSAKSEDEPEGCRTRYRKRGLDPSDIVINTTITFADRQASQQAASHTDTQTALAQLYAHVSNMPESTKKRKLLKQFNKANGTGTPMISPKHKRSKSLGDSIKKFVGKNHKRRGSGHSIQVHAVLPNNAIPTPATPTPSTVSFAAGQHTPIIKHLGGKVCCTPTPATPVMQLFKNKQAILPDSPRVHIVDLKQYKSFTSTKMGRTCQDSPVRASIHSSISSIPSSCGSSNSHVDDLENYPREPLIREGHRLRPKKSPHSPVYVTPDKRFEKPTAFISPITKSYTKAAKSIQNHVMTPGSRVPMALIQTP